MTCSPGDIVELVIEDLTVEGGGLARLAGSAGTASRVVFTDRGLPGECVRARVTRVKSRFALAEVMESLSPSPDAETPHCRYGGVCGGCSWPGLRYGAESAWKEKQLRETLRRVGGVDAGLLRDGAVFLPLIPSPETLGYRNKMEFAFAPDGERPGPAAHDASGRALLGLRRRGSHEVLEVADCPLAAFPVGPVLDAVRGWAAEAAEKDGLRAWTVGDRGGDRGGFLRHLVLRRYEDRCIAELITSPCPGPNPGGSREAAAVRRLADLLCPEDGTPGLCAGFVHTLRSGGVAVAYGEKLLFARGETAMRETVAGTLFEAPVPAFVQVNTPAAALLYEVVREWAGDIARQASSDASASTSCLAGRRVLDLYSGVGGLAVTLAQMPEYASCALYGVEEMPVAAKAAERNAARLVDTEGTPGIRFEAAGVETVLRGMKEAPFLIVADPPRAGLSPATRAELARLKPDYMMMVSCNPAGLARDMAAFAADYELVRVRGVDLFPRTPHLESVALLRRRGL